MITRSLAEFVTQTPVADVPPAAIDAACRGVIDTLGCALAGSAEPVAEIAADWVAEAGARGAATVWGRDLSTGPADAAFANGVSAHALDFDDSHPSVRGHASASSVPTAIAVGQHVGAGGREVLAAYAIGIEVGGKVGRAFGHGLVRGGWHPTAIVGALAATAVAARLSGHDAATLRQAWGIVASELGGLVRNFGTMTKPLHAGHAARSAVVASAMAAAGMSADRDIFDGAGSLFDTYGAEGEAIESLIAGLGAPWEIVDPGNYLKRWPCCYSSHRPIGALLRLIDDHRIVADEVDEVVVSFLPAGDSALVSRTPKTGLEGKFSIEYVMAALLIDRGLTLDSFADAQVMRPAVQTLIGKVRRRTIPDAKNYTGLVGYNEVAVTTPRGRFETREDRTPGSPAWPVGDDGRLAKFTECAGPLLGDEGARALWQLAIAGSDLADIGVLAGATVPRRSGAREPMRASG